MKKLKQLFNKHYVEIDDLEYEALIYDSLGGYISLLDDIDLEELLNYFIDVSINDIESALYNGTLHFYKCNTDYLANSDYIAVLEN